MRRTRLACLVIINLACLTALSAATRPRYGGVLRVEARARVNSMDPRELIADFADEAAADRLLGLVFDRLVRLDDAGRPQPALAASWQHDANFTHWQFQIRAGVKFHDGTPVTPAEIAAALQTETSIPWPATVSAGTVVFDFKNPEPNLVFELATGHTFIFHPAQDTVFGTGPFRIADWQPKKHLALVASEDDWVGRPFVDRIEISLGVTPQQQLVDLELGKADVVELQPNLTRSASQSGERIAASAPVELYSLAVTPRGAAQYDPRFSQALSLSIDRTAIVNVFLQHQGEPAGSLLPQWISGYAFLFPTAPNLEQAKQIRAQFSAPPLMALDYDGSDPMAATVAQRIAINAQDAGIHLSVFPATATGGTSKADVHLVRRRLEAPDAEQALDGFFGDTLAAQGVAAPAGEARVEAAMIALDTPELRYRAERNAIDSGRIIPIAFVPEIFGLGPAVRDWMPPRWGGWRLEDVWLDAPPHTASAENVPAAGAGKGNNRP